MNIASQLSHFSILLEAKSIDVRLKRVAQVATLFWLIGIFLSLSLWLPDREIPLLPYLDLPNVLPELISIGLLAFMVMGLSIYLFTSKMLWLRIAFAAMIVLLIQDQLRWQPWVYMYSLMLVPFIFPIKLYNHRLIAYLQLIIIAVYLWSGIHKMNPHFINENFSLILSTFFNLEPNTTAEWVLMLGYIIPTLEILMGLLLIFNRTRIIGLALAFGTHVSVVFYLSPMGVDSNSIVIPWNIAMIVLGLLLFASPYPKKTLLSIDLLKSKLLIGIVIVMYCLPILNIFGKWDHYLSFSLYSNKAPLFYVASEYNSFGQFSDVTEPFIKKIAPFRGSGGYIDINAWCYASLNVPFYPEDRVFKQLTQHFCATDPNPDKLIFIINHPHWRENDIESFDCVSR